MDFRNDVLDKSHNIPVLVDFWAEWCGPCRILGPVLDKLNAEDDRWELVKVNTEEHGDVASAYGIMSIPNVKLFSEGEVIGEFVGALPEQQVRKWLDENLPTEAKSEWHALKAKESDWPDMNYARDIGDFIQKYPEIDEAYLDLAKHMVLQTPDEAIEVLDSKPLMKISPDTVQDIKTLAELLNLDREYDAISGGELLREAGGYLREPNIDSALKTLIDAIMTNKKIANNLPQRASVAIFRLLGDTHPLTGKYRKLFEMALY